RRLAVQGGPGRVYLLVARAGDVRRRAPGRLRGPDEGLRRGAEGRRGAVGVREEAAGRGDRRADADRAREHRLRRGVSGRVGADPGDRKSTRLNSSHVSISYAVFCLKKKNKRMRQSLFV